MPCSRRTAFCGAQYNGGVAQLGERVNGIHEVRGSIPLASTDVPDLTGGGRSSTRVWYTKDRSVFRTSIVRVPRWEKALGG